MDIRYRELRGYTILEMHGDIDYYSVGEMKNAVFKFINEKIPNIILDLRDVEYMDSSGIGLIVTAHKVMTNYGGKLGLINVRDDIMELLKLATVDTLMAVYMSEDELK